MRASEPVLWIDDEEYAVTVPGEDDAVRIVSASALPLRCRAESRGVHHRPAFAGTAVSIGDARYEVVDEERRDGRVLYLLRPWPSDHIIRDQVAYGPAFLARVREERRRTAERRRGQRWFWPLYPMVGLLPEGRQMDWCERWGLDPVKATQVSGVVEAAALFLLWRSLSFNDAALVLGPVSLAILAALFRALGAMITREIAGAWHVVGLLRVAEALSSDVRDLTLLPMTREAFWARLAMPDRQSREPDGTLTVRSVLPHLTWTPGARVEGEGHGDWWRVEAAEAEIEQRRLVYTYRLSSEAPAGEAGATPSRPPRPTAYQDSVRARVDAEWDDLRRSGFDGLIGMMPADVQNRAFASAGGPRAARRTTFAGALFFLAGAVWMALSPRVINVATGIVFAWDAAARLVQLSRGRYAPSLFARWIAPYLRPERVSYHAHREAERAVLLGRG